MEDAIEKMGLLLNEMTGSKSGIDSGNSTEKMDLLSYGRKIIFQVGI
jgi:hypothetical protein